MIRRGTISVGKAQTSHATLPAFLFMVEYANQVRAVFSECTGLTAEIDVFEYQEGGENTHVHRSPQVVQYHAQAWYDRLARSVAVVAEGDFRRPEFAPEYLDYPVR
jgi:hypothetical protein